MSTLSSQAEVRVVESFAAINAQQWNALAGDQPFLRHEYLAALEGSACVSLQSGWKPQHLTLWAGDTLTGAMPLYLKYHSYGEYVFDWAWAEAYQQHGLDYYPKLVNAIPFTPVTGQRVLAGTQSDRELLLLAAIQLAGDLGASSLHCLFPVERQAKELQTQGMLLRSGTQFHWRNHDYANFDAYLASMSHDKRKKIRQERRKVNAAGVEFEQIAGRDATSAHWAFFNDCYNTTYRQHRSTPYLNLDFFTRIAAAMPDNLLLIVAHRAGRPIASALNLLDARTLYGRYWGSMEDVPGLHFETCYYQAIEFCIAHGMHAFEGGAQGAHKVARGFLPTPTWSAHWLAHPEFSRAVEDFLARETEVLAHYMTELNERSPFKKTDD